MLTVKDKHGQLHAGAIGLFDDDDEYEERQRRARKASARETRRQERLAKKRAANEVKGNWKRGLLAKIASFCFSGDSKSASSATVTEKTKEKSMAKTRERTPTDSQIPGEGQVQEQSPSGAQVEHNPQLSVYGQPTSHTQEPDNPPPYQSSTTIDDGGIRMYHASAIHPEPSIFLEECGMVRVRSDEPCNGGWTIVPRSAII